MALSYLLLLTYYSLTYLLLTYFVLLVSFSHYAHGLQSWRVHLVRVWTGNYSVKIMDIFSSLLAGKHQKYIKLAISGHSILCIHFSYDSRNGTGDSLVRSQSRYNLFKDTRKHRSGSKNAHREKCTPILIMITICAQNLMQALFGASENLMMVIGPIYAT